MQLNRDFIINHFTTNIKDYKRLAVNITGGQNHSNDADDLFQECTLQMLEYSEERLLSYWNKTEGLKPFFIRMLTLQYRSKTSYFHSKYRKQEQFIAKQGAEIVYNGHQLEIDVDIDLHDLKKVREKVYIYNGEMFPCELEEMAFNLYVETGSLRKALAALPDEHADKFDLKTIQEIVKKYRRTIKKNYDKAA